MLWRIRQESMSEQRLKKLVWLGLILVAFHARAETAAPLLQVQLPSKPSSLPKPLPPANQPGFKYRGSKGWAWTPEQYLEEIPWLEKFKMNFLMNCYSSLFTSTQPWINEWWKPLPDAKKAAYAKVIQSCREHGVTFCFCMNPQLYSKRPLRDANAGDLNLLFQRYAWAQSQGVKWFSICVDDAGWGGKTPAAAAADDAKIVNSIFWRLREKDPDAQMIFCPGPYWGDGSPPDHHAYLQRLGNEMNPDVYVFWTGDNVVTSRITAVAARSYKNVVHHRLFLWDNYPVNDGQSTLNLGPLNGRSQDLCDVIDGYMSNPMASQNQINRIPLATCAEYACNPAEYDAARSIGRAISLLCSNGTQQQALKDLVETYPGFIVAGGGTGNNPVRNKFDQLLKDAGKHDAAGEFLRHMENLSARFGRAFPGEFDSAKKTIGADILWMRQKLTLRP